MKKFKQFLKEDASVNERCWDGYKPTPGKKAYEKGSCMKDEDVQEDVEHDGKKITLNKPFRTPDGPKKFAVYVKNDKGNVVKVTFGDPNMEIKRDSDKNRANFRSRHNCDDPGPKWKARYWSCKMWSNKPVSKLTETPEPAAVTTAQQLFVAFLHNTGAKDHVSKLAAKTDKVFLGTGTDSKYDYTIDIDKQTVTATSKTSTKRGTYVWDKRTNKVKMLEAALQESAPPDAEIEKWINDNKQR